MKLLFRQRAFSWFDSYDIYDENENTVYVVKGQLSWGHCLKIYDPEEQQELGTVKEEILTWLPKFELYEGETCIGTLKKELTFFKPMCSSGTRPSPARTAARWPPCPRNRSTGRTPTFWTSPTRRMRFMC